MYPPKCIDIVTNENFNTYSTILTQSQEDIEDIFAQEEQGGELQFPTPLEFLLINCYNNQQYAQLTKEAFYFFLHQEVTFIYDEKMILIGNLEEIILRIQDLASLTSEVFLTEDNFLSFQNLIRECLNDKIVEPPDPNLHPKIKAMKAKQRLRDKVKAKQESKKGTSFYDSLAAICCMGIGITPLNIGEMSYVAARSIIDRYQAKEKYDLDIRSILTGVDSKKIKPRYWMENLEN